MAEATTKRRPRATRTTDGAVVKDQVAVSDIILDSDVQPRENISAGLIGEYAEAMREGKSFPEIVIYRDPETGALIAADGWHRVMAAREADKATVMAEVRPGTKRDAILYSVGANAEHGLRRTNEDKRRAVHRLMDDDEWGQWSDNTIAEKVGVSQPFVSSIRKQRSRGAGGDGEGRRVVTTVDGAEMDVSRIGRNRRRDPEAEGADAEATSTEATATNGHAPVALVPDDEDEDDISPVTGIATVEDEDEIEDESPVDRFARRLADTLLQLGDFEAEEVFAAMDPETRDRLADRWDDIIGQFDGYSEALEKVLAPS